jgi:hypothetical protein
MFWRPCMLGMRSELIKHRTLRINGVITHGPFGMYGNLLNSRR